jgi:dihydroflavonol-4-reductase
MRKSFENALDVFTWLHPASYLATMELITGATGIVGLHRVAWLLERDRPVRALFRQGSDLDRCKKFIDARVPGAWSKLDWFEANLDDSHALECAMHGVETVFHAAGKVSFEARDAERLFEVNALGTAHIVNAALEAGVKNLIHISSVAAIQRSGGSSPEAPITEDVEWPAGGGGASTYGKSKRAGELEAWRGAAEGLNVFALCPSIVIGAGNFGVSSGEMWSRVASGMDWAPPGASGFVAATDIATAAGELLDAAVADRPGIWGERFILSEGTHSFGEVLGGIALALNLQPPTKSPPVWLLSLAWRPLEIWSRLTGTKALLTRDLMQTATTSVYYSTEKLAAVLPDFRFRPLKDAVAETARLFPG